MESIIFVYIGELFLSIAVIMLAFAFTRFSRMLVGILRRLSELEKKVDKK